MEENREVFLNILKDIGISDLEDLQTGSLDKVHIVKKTMELQAVVKFPTVIDVASIAKLRKAFMDFFTNENQFTQVSLSVVYENSDITSEMLQKYYEYIIAIFEAKKPRYAILNPLHKSFDNNKIRIFVALEEEAQTVTPLLSEINKIFKLYGLKSKITVEISKFEVPIQNLIDERIKKTTDAVLLQQEKYENLTVEPKKEKSVKKPRAKSEINGKPTPLKDIPASEADVIEYVQRHDKANFVVLVDLVSAEVREIKSNKTGVERTFKIYTAVGTDGTDSITMTTFVNLQNSSIVEFYEKKALAGKRVRVYGYAEYDKYNRDVVLKILDMQIEGDVQVKEVYDDAVEKRVELHAHTKMSTQDGVMEVDEYVERAKTFGFTSIAVTDHDNIHVWPDLEKACKKAGIKPIYGTEGSMVDEKTFKIAFSNEDIDLTDATFVVYDLETTGLSSNFEEIIEISACKVKHGMIIDEFSEYVKPKLEINQFITKLTSITNDDVRNADPIEVLLPRFKAFIEGCILVAHNATFDNSHLYASLKRTGLYEHDYPTIDTLQLLKVRYGTKLKKFNLAAMSKFFDVELVQHHRAIFDARATAHSFIKMYNDLLDDHINNYKDINSLINVEQVYKYAYPSHITILTLNEIGKKNMYQIISDSHTVHFHEVPRIMKSYLENHREGLLIGSSCINGDVFEIANKRSYEELLEVMKFYDYIELQPLPLYDVNIKDQDPVKTKQDNVKTVNTIIRAAKQLGKLLVATGDVHHLTKDDKIYRDIYISAPLVGGGRHPLVDCKNVPSFHFRNTEEMLNEFSFLDEKMAYEIVVTNTNKIAKMVEDFSLFPKELFAPKDDFLSDRGIPSTAKATIDMTYKTAEEMYGAPLHPYIKARLDKELKSIIGNKFAPIYYIAYMLVDYSKKAGYIVGSRGSVGSSLVAHMMGITEVNGLPPHYYCSNCSFVALKLSDAEKETYPLDANQQKFDASLHLVGTGFDLPHAKCPICGRELSQNGVDIPFETFLGFEGNKTPDIDLNFSGDFQGQAHEFCRTVFGVDRAFRAGTIGTIAEKKAYGYVKGYFERKGILARNTEVSRLAKKIEGVKQSTGQHPGGIVVIPKDISYYDIIPIQYPADDINAKWRTTHFDYHKFEDNLLKLDILGHDDPTMIRHLMDFVHKYPDEFPFSNVNEIPLTDHEVFKLFSGLESLGLTPDKTFGQIIGTTGLPEFGTQLTKDMLNDIRPTTIDALLKISGLSHGKGVWQGNAKDFMMGKNSNYKGSISFDQLIGCRDDIMVYLISKNLPPKDAFNIMEKVRKGKGVSSEHEALMRKYNIPDWYIASCKLINYMFPKAHATAYVIMALRIGWFKVYRPIFYYAGFFSRRADAFDVESMVMGFDAIKAKLTELDEKIKKKLNTVKDEDTFATLLLAIEMVSRGLKFKQMSITESEAINFKVMDDRKTLLIPFGALDSLGATTALSIVKARNESPFTSKKDILKRTKLNATQFERMNGMGVFGDLPDDDQIGLF